LLYGGHGFESLVMHGWFRGVGLYLAVTVASCVAPWQAKVYIGGGEPIEEESKGMTF